MDDIDAIFKCIELSRMIAKLTSEDMLYLKQYAEEGSNYYYEDNKYEPVDQLIKNGYLAVIVTSPSETEYHCKVMTTLKGFLAIKLREEVYDKV